MPQFRNTTVDIWRSMPHIASTGEVDVSTYALLYGLVPCEVVEVSAAEKTMMGVNVSTAMRRLFIGGNTFSAVVVLEPNLILQGYGPALSMVLSGWKTPDTDTLAADTPLKENDIIKTNQDATYWRVSGPPQHWSAPKAFWQADLTILRSRPSEVS